MFNHLTLGRFQILVFIIFIQNPVFLVNSRRNEFAEFLIYIYLTNFIIILYIFIFISFTSLYD